MASVEPCTGDCIAGDRWKRLPKNMFMSNRATPSQGPKAWVHNGSLSDALCANMSILSATNHKSELARLHHNMCISDPQQRQIIAKTAERNSNLGRPLPEVILAQTEQRGNGSSTCFAGTIVSTDVPR